MFRRFARLAPVLALTSAAATMAVTASVEADAAGRSAGPTAPFTKAIMHNNVIPLVHAAMITRTRHGYLYRAGQQNSHLVVTRVKAGVRFRDTGTRTWRSVASGCKRQKVRVGIAAVCGVSRSTSGRHPMLLEIWPRLGNDFVDGHTLPAAFEMAVLADAGRDIVLGGAGNDFINGAQNGDRVRGGGGNDWLRTGIGDDRIWGGSGNDDLVGVEGRDTIRGGGGNDRVGGGPGNDRLFAGGGRDAVVCGSGADAARADGSDRVNQCESVRRR